MISTSLIYSNIRLFIDRPVIIEGLIDEFACFRCEGRSMLRALLPETEMLKYLFNNFKLGNEAYYFHFTAAMWAT